MHSGQKLAAGIKSLNLLIKSFQIMLKTLNLDFI